MIGLQEKYKVAILDNCEIETLYRLSKENVAVEKTLESYDYILIPGWVWVEVCDSEWRKNYIDSLIARGIPIVVLHEIRYREIVPEELILLTFFDMAIGLYGKVKGYFKKHILKGKEKVDIDYLYEEWVEKIYDEWPIEGEEIICSNGTARKQKKNAGEISIVFLAFLLTYQRKGDLEITIWTHDSDCKCCIDEINRKLHKNKGIIMARKTVFSYKNLDTILKEMYEKKIVQDEKIDKLIDKIRNERKITYVLRKSDNSNELRIENIDNEQFKKLVYDEKVNIIW